MGSLSPTLRVWDSVLRPPHVKAAVHVVEPVPSQPLLSVVVFGVEVQVAGLVQSLVEVPLCLAPCNQFNSTNIHKKNRFVRKNTDRKRRMRRRGGRGGSFFPRKRLTERVLNHWNWPAVEDIMGSWGRVTKTWGGGGGAGRSCAEGCV